MASKKPVLLTLLLALSLSLTTSCSSAEDESVELVVFGAASLTESLTEIATLYQEVAPNVEIIYTFDSSGTLLTQIESGATCDLFFSAAQSQMNTLEEGGYLAEGSRMNLLENTLALVVPEGNPANINSFEDLSGDYITLLAIGNSDVPAGVYGQALLEDLELWTGLVEEQKLTYGSNVKEVTAQVSAGAVDAGIVYSTDGTAAGLEIVDDFSGNITYPVALLADSQVLEEAQAFLTFLQGEEAGAVFEGAGFTLYQ